MITQNILRTSGKKIGKTALWIGTWVTPLGLLKLIIRTDISVTRYTTETPIDNLPYARKQNLAGLIMATLLISTGIGGFIYTVSDSTNPTTLSPSAIICFMLMFFGIYKGGVHLSNWTEICRRKKSPEYSWGKFENISLEMDEIAKQVFLFKTVSSKFLFILSGLFIFLAMATPENVRRLIELRGILNSPGLIAGMLFSSILFLKALIAERDTSLLRKAGAKAGLMGFTTINNQAHTILQQAMILLTVAFLGNQLIIALDKSQLLTGWLAIARLVVFSAMLLFSLSVAKSFSALSGLDTARSPNEIGMSAILTCRAIHLPQPSASERANPLPQIPLAVPSLFGIALFISLNSNWASMIAAFTVVAPCALLLTIQHFHVQLND